MTVVVQQPDTPKVKSVRDVALSVIEHMDDGVIGCVIVSFGKDGLPLVTPIGLNYAGRLKAVAAAVDMFADEIFEKPGFSTRLKSYAASILKVSDSMKPKGAK